MFVIALQVMIAWFYSHVLEWIIHKYLLHNRKAGPAFKHHFRYHHLAARRNGMLDNKYRKDKWYHWLVDDEIVGLSLLSVIHLPIAWFFPWAYGILVISALHYFVVHRLAHRDYHWARKNLPHHYEHHMGPDQAMNWGVRSSWVDKLFNTRKLYIGTKREILVYRRICSAEKRGVRVRSHRIERQRY